MSEPSLEKRLSRRQAIDHMARMLGAAGVGLGIAGLGGGGSNPPASSGGSDHQVLVDSADTIAAFLGLKIVAGPNITFTTLNPGANEQIQISAASASSDHKLLVDASDTTANYLGPKLVAGNGIVITTLNPGANEQSQIAIPDPINVNQGTAGTDPWLANVNDRAGRLVGIVYGDVGQLLQRPSSRDALVQLRTAGVEYDARQIRALTASDIMTANQGAAAPTTGAWPFEMVDANGNIYGPFASDAYVGTLVGGAIADALATNADLAYGNLTFNPLTTDLLGKLRVSVAPTISSATFASSASLVAIVQSGLVLRVSNVWTGTVFFEGSMDGSLWFAVRMRNAADDTVSTSTTVNGNFFLLDTGLYQYRARFLRTTGSVTFNLNSSLSPSNFLVTGADPDPGDAGLVTRLAPGSTAIGRNTGTVSVGNSSTSLLGIAGVFTGAYEDVKDYAFLTVSIFSDQASAAGGLEFDWSHDGVNLDASSTTSVQASSGRAFSITPRARYFRVVYTNGAVGQGVFRLGTVYHPTGTGLISRPYSQTMDQNNYAQQVRSVTDGFDDTNFVHVHARLAEPNTTDAGLVSRAIAYGNVAHGVADAGSPVKTGGIANTGLPAAVTTGQRVNALHDVYGRRRVIQDRPKLLGLYYGESGNLTILAAAHAATAGFFWIVNTSATVIAYIRSIGFVWSGTAVTAFPTSPRITVERVTFTGTPSGAQVTPAKRDSTDAANTATWRTASTGLTLTGGAIVESFVVGSILTAVGAISVPEEIWQPKDDDALIALRLNEGIVVRQADAGSASDTRKIVLTISWEER